MTIISQMKSYKLKSKRCITYNKFIYIKAEEILCFYLNLRRIFMLELFLTFFKIGISTFGGGYAMIPLIEREMINEKKWIDKDELLEII
ncbi:MAG: chromate transporter, partial [Cetobacterium sp.]